MMLLIDVFPLPLNPINKTFLLEASPLLLPTAAAMIWFVFPHLRCFFYFVSKKTEKFPFEAHERMVRR